MSEDQLIEQIEDPFYQFECWCRENGFSDLSDCDPNNVDLKRLDQAVAAYGEAKETFNVIIAEPLRYCELCGEPEHVFGVVLNEEKLCPQCEGAKTE